MESKANYTLVGLAVLILTAALISVALWLSVGFDQKKYNYYLVYMNETVSGLNQESPVKYNGVQVGYVKAIELDNKNPQRVRILLAIDENTPITTSTTATLISQGITGNTYVGLAASSSSLQPLQKHSDEDYPVIPSRPSLFNQLDKVLKEVSGNVNDLSVQVKKIFDEENVVYVKKTLANLQKVTGVIAANKKNINQSIVNTDILLRNFAKTSKELPQLTKEMQVSLAKVRQAGEKVSDTMNSGKIALDKFSQQTIPPAISLLNRLNGIAANLEKVSNQLRQNPSVVIRGTTAPKPGPGE
ncbi:MAG: ABC transporter substrate-binding protein [Legionellales bacterium RIFCSPHIGHO2_12_FULL_42_9]|nr:MAG: ABC transporter substrate-binding protein [Legionellales bacterium RIFCSPHIGHO2_12_FULL_42_9]